MPTLTKDQEKVLHEWEKTPLDAAAQKLIDQGKNSLKYLHRGARLGEPTRFWRFARFQFRG